MAGLFGFFLREPRDVAWADRRFAAMRARMSGTPGHHTVAIQTASARVGQSGPGILPGSLTMHGAAPGPALLAEGECYHRDHALMSGESPGGPWAWVRERWLGGGASAISRVDGLFTLALVDAEPARLRLINDRYGSRRVYTLETRDAFVFASELGPMMEWPESGDIDDLFVRQSVCMGSALDDRTWLAHVRLMPPATEIDVTPDRVSARRYWRWEDLPPPSRASTTGGLPGPLATELRSLWLNAMTARVGGDRVGQQLSGGLDSRLILGDGAAARTRDWVAISYGEPGSDEVRFAGQAAAAAGVPWLHWALPEPDWLEARARYCLAHDGVVDIVNAYQATMIDRIGSLMRWEISGYLGDLVLGSTYEIETPDEAMSYLPYWHSPVAIPEGDARDMVVQSIGNQSARGWIIDTKCRRAINAWPHTAVNVLEVRKPFMDYALVEFAAGLPRAYRDRHDAHRALLAFHPALAAVPWQKTGARLDASSAERWAARGRRVLYRTSRSLLARVGVDRPPWVRGAVQLDSWLADQTVQATLRESLTATRARVGRTFGTDAVHALLDATLDDRSVAHEPLLHLYRAERMLAHLADRRPAPEP